MKISFLMVVSSSTKIKACNSEEKPIIANLLHQLKVETLTHEVTILCWQWIQSLCMHFKHLSCLQLLSRQCAEHTINKWVTGKQLGI
jgi:hypothetical protein